MAHLQRQRAELLMAAAGIDALVLLSPESFLYATGVNAGVATMWRRAGAVAVLVPADASAPMTAIASDLFAPGFRAASGIEDVRENPIWVETSDLSNFDLQLTPEQLIRSAWKEAGRGDDFSRPTTFDPLVCFRHLADALAERGLIGRRIGFEASAISIHDFGGLKSTLDKVELVDAERVITELKMVKSVEEIGKLRQAVTIAESGICAVRDAISIGVERDDLALEWSRAVNAHPERAALTGAWEYISVGPAPWGGNATARLGDIIKVDVGCLVDGYTSDSGRTFVLGPPSDLQARIYGALAAGFNAGLPLLRPGVKLSEVHRVTLEAIRREGFPGYSRGHFGHGLGAGLGGEEWPFISAGASVLFEPAMVLAFECPWYIDGVGGMIIENQLLITDTGCEMMNGLPADLVEIST